MDQPIKLGRYRHYKGKDCEVIGVAKHSETLEDLVIYRPLYTPSKEFVGYLWARPKTIFEDKVTINGRKMPHFEYLGPLS